mmetsp:Transcript_104585/g.263303  ORF Transcript_104585/g.263303 Transcript_104585/m.263303 type:complete len:549 (-) Transcript_104585:121-1767(-)
MGCSGSSGQKLVAKEGFFAEYTLGSKLGQGSFGQVRVATHNESQDTYVVKILDTRKKRDQTAAAHTACAIDVEREYRALREMAIWHRLGKSDYCINLLEVFILNGMIYAVMERCQGSLLDRLDEMEEWTEIQMVSICREMLLGIEHVHRKGIVHRDVKPENFLCGLDGTVKLADFGLATLNWALPALLGHRGMSGTVPYMSPEMLASKWYNEKTDIWSYGVCVYLMVIGEFPYGKSAREPEAMKVAVLTGGPPNFHKTLWDESASFAASATDFCGQLLARELKERATAGQALAHEFLREPPIGGLLLRAESAEMASMWSSEESAFSQDVKPLVRMVRAFSSDFKSKVEPGVADSLDKLILGQQAAHINSPMGSIRRSASLPPLLEEEGSPAVFLQQVQRGPLVSRGRAASMPEVTPLMDSEGDDAMGRKSSGGSTHLASKRSRDGSKQSSASASAGAARSDSLDDLSDVAVDWAPFEDDVEDLADQASHAEPWLLRHFDCEDWRLAEEDDAIAGPLLPRPVPRLPPCHLTSSGAGLVRSRWKDAEGQK